MQFDLRFNKNLSLSFVMSFNRVYFSIAPRAQNLARLGAVGGAEYSVAF